MFFIVIILVIVVVDCVLGMTVIPQNYVGLVETFGKYDRTVQSGLNFIIPGIQRVRKVSLALQPLSLNPYSVITKDNADVQVSVTLNYLVSDPIKYFYNNTNSEESMSQLVRGHLRDIIGRMDLNQALGETSAINKELGDAVDDLTGIFGVKVVRINIDELDPSEEIQRAMDQQLTADRRKQAQILEAEGNARKIELETKAQNDAMVSQAEARGKAKQIATDAETYRINHIQDALANADDNYFKNQSINAFVSLAEGNNDLIVMDQNKIDQLGDLPVAKKMLGLDKQQGVSRKSLVNHNSNDFGQNQAPRNAYNSAPNISGGYNRDASHGTIGGN